MARSNLQSRMANSPILRYGLAVTSVAIALVWRFLPSATSSATSSLSFSW